MFLICVEIHYLSPRGADLGFVFPFHLSDFIDFGEQVQDLIIEWDPSI